MLLNTERMHEACWSAEPQGCSERDQAGSCPHGPRSSSAKISMFIFVSARAMSIHSLRQYDKLLALDNMPHETRILLVEVGAIKGRSPSVTGD